MEKNILLKVENIKKSYKKKPVLKDVSFQINDGERVALIGANGAGKSTLSEIISLIRKPDSGNIIYKYGSDEREIRKNMGIQFQRSVFPFGFVVKDLIQFYIKINKIEMDKAEMLELLKQFHFLGFEKKYINDLSGGQQQRLNVLLSMINQPEFLILDEVSTGLDLEAKTDIHNYIVDYINSRKATLLLVSHSASEIELFCDRVIALDKGEIVDDIKVKDIIKEYKTVNTYLEKFFSKRRKEIEKEQSKLLKEQIKKQKGKE